MKAAQTRMMVLGMERMGPMRDGIYRQNLQGLGRMDAEGRERMLRAPCSIPSSWANRGAIYCGGNMFEKGERESGSVNFQVCVNFEISVQQPMGNMKEAALEQVRAQKK